jgi:rod shape-determining protein MreC
LQQQRLTQLLLMRFIYTKAFVLFASCLAALAILVFMQNKGWLDPVRQAFLQSPRPVAALSRAAARPVSDFFSTIYSLRRIVQENMELKREVLDLQQKLAGFDQETRENEALRREMGFVAASKYDLVACTVLSQNAFGLTDTLVLNCGSGRGISEGQAVISQGHLVGKVIYAGKADSTVLVATSSSFFADAELSKTGADAVVTGSFGSGMYLDRLSQSDEVQSGWSVVTAGINQKIPQGILIGQVGQVASSASDLFKKTTLVSPVDFSNLDFVFVVKP